MHNIGMYNHLKFKSVQDVFKIIQPNCWMASVDLKDAFYSVPIIKDHQKYLKFQWLEEIYIFLRVSNWYSEVMHIFPKSKNPSFLLWKQELLPVTLVDNSYLQGATKEQCNQNVNATINLLTSLGFTIHTKKVSSIRWIFRFCYRQRIIQKKSATGSWMLPFLFFVCFFFSKFYFDLKMPKMIFKYGYSIIIKCYLPHKVPFALLLFFRTLPYDSSLFPDRLHYNVSQNKHS